MTAWHSALYTGLVGHQRIRPRRHTLRYRAFWMLFDLDELPALSSSFRLFSHNRFNLFSFHDRDHGGGTPAMLRTQIETHLEQADIQTNDGAIRLLCMPRILGYVFNPISIYFCYRADDSLAAILYEVNNTFGQRHSYLLPVENSAETIIRQSCRKRLYVSPFMEMEMSYHFRVTAPAKKIGVAVNALDADGLVIATSLSGDRREFSDAALLGVFFAYPLLTLKVIVGIHWEALKLWLKGMRITPRPPAPDRPVTSGSHKD